MVPNKMTKVEMMVKQDMITTEYDSLLLHVHLLGSRRKTVHSLFPIKKIYVNFDLEFSRATLPRTHGFILNLTFDLHTGLYYII